jgi:hypothetical protein
MTFYELQKKENGKWVHKGFYMKYENLQRDFVYKDGLFRSVPHEFKD